MAYWHMDGYEHMIEGLLYSMRIPADMLDDARQEAYIGVMRAIEEYSPSHGASLLTFANRCARFAVIAWIRKLLGRGKYKPVFVSLVRDYAYDARIEAGVLHEELRRGVRSLCGRDRKVADMLIAGGLDKDLAKQLGLSPQRVFQLKAIAMSKLKLEMGIAA